MIYFSAIQNTLFLMFIDCFIKQLSLAISIFIPPNRKIERRKVSYNGSCEISVYYKKPPLSTYLNARSQQMAPKFTHISSTKHTHVCIRGSALESGWYNFCQPSIWKHEEIYALTRSISNYRFKIRLYITFYQIHLSLDRSIWAKKRYSEHNS